MALTTTPQQPCPSSSVAAVAAAVTTTRCDGWKFRLPQKTICSVEDIAAFKNTTVYRFFIEFLVALGNSVKGYPVDTSSCIKIRDAKQSTQKLVALLDRVGSWIKKFPPIEEGKRRFGNAAFRDFFDCLQKDAENLVASLVESVLLLRPHEMATTEEEETARKIETIIMKEDPMKEDPMKEDPMKEDPMKEDPMKEDPMKVMGVISVEPSALPLATAEIAVYLKASFGDRTRIDYGSGHELNFACFLFCLRRIGFLEDLKETVLLVFTRYLRLMRELQSTYSLEPAGSRGVWGLDDFHFLPFLLGAAQLVGQSDITPAQVSDPDIVRRLANEYLYIDAIKWIMDTKRGVPFAECSPLLHDISAVPSWSKIQTGMVKMYEAEVMGKLPVMRHFLVGSLLSDLCPAHQN